MDIANRPLKRQRMFQDDVDVPAARDESRARLKSCFEDVFAKYSRDFSGVGDEVDMETGEVVVNNGHLTGMAQEFDAGSRLHSLGSGPNSEWDSVSEEADAHEQQFESETTPDPGLDEQTRRFGDNIASEILNIFTAHRIASNAKGTTITYLSRHHRPSSGRANSTSIDRDDQYDSVDDPIDGIDVATASVARPQISPPKIRNPSNYSIWDPRPSPQPSFGNAYKTDSWSLDRRSWTRWTMQDQSTLVRLRAQQYTFRQIAAYFQDRTPEAVKQRFVQIMNNPARKAQVQQYIEQNAAVDATPVIELPVDSESERNWSPHEVMRLIQLRHHENLGFQAIADRFPGRSKDAVKGRYVRLKPEEWHRAGFEGKPTAVKSSTNTPSAVAPVIGPQDLTSEATSEHSADHALQDPRSPSTARSAEPTQNVAAPASYQEHVLGVIRSPAQSTETGPKPTRATSVVYMAPTTPVARVREPSVVSSSAQGVPKSASSSKQTRVDMLKGQGKGPHFARSPTRSASSPSGRNALDDDAGDDDELA